MSENPWAEGTETMMKSWSEAQKLMWEGWADLAQASQGNTNPFAGAAQEWQRLASASLKNWQTRDDFSGMAERMLNAQGTLMQIMNHTAQAWQAMLPALSQNGDWQSVLNKYSEEWQQQILKTPLNVQEASQGSAELWALYTQELQKLSGLMLGTGLPMTNGKFEASEVSQLIDRFWNAYDKTLGRMMDAPTMGYSRELNRKVLQGFDAWLELRRADMNYQLVISNIWTQTFDLVMQSLVEKAQNNQSPQTLKDMTNLLIGIADDVFVREFAQPAYIEAQGKLLNSTMAYRLRERALLEAVMESYGLPTRTELDETHQTIYEMRREMRELKKELKALKAKPATPTEPEVKKTVTTDLKLIGGIGPKLEHILNENGIHSLDQIASLSDAEVAELDDKLGTFRGRILRDEWREQAQALLAEGSH